MMKGLLCSVGIHASEQSIGEYLCRVSPSHQDACGTATACQAKPVPCHADYFAHKLHLDHNEKMLMLGVTHIYAVDVYREMIIGFVTMPVLFFVFFTKQKQSYTQSIHTHTEQYN